MNHKMRGRGRPRSRVSKDAYLRLALDRIFRGRLLDWFTIQLKQSGVIKEQRAIVGELKFAKPGAVDLFGKDSLSDFDTMWVAFSKPPNTDPEAIAFSDGLQFAIDVIGSSLFEKFLDLAIKNVALTFNATKISKQRAEIENRMIARASALSPERSALIKAAIESMNKNYPLPTDISRKYRKSRLTRQKLIRFMIAVKESPGKRSVKTIAKNMGMTEAEIISHAREAKRQKYHIEIRTIGREQILYLEE